MCPVGQSKEELTTDFQTVRCPLEGKGMAVTGAQPGESGAAHEGCNLHMRNKVHCRQMRPVHSVVT